MRTRAYVRGKVIGNGKVGGIFWKTTFKGNKSGLYYFYVFSTTPKFVHIPWVWPVICLCRKAGHIIQPGSGLPMSCSLFMETSCYQGDRVLSGSVFISGHTWWAQAFCSFTSCVARTPKATRSPNTIHPAWSWRPPTKTTTLVCGHSSNWERRGQTQNRLE